MPRANKGSYQQYMREYMRAKRHGLTGINRYFMVGASGLEPPTSASRTRRADLTALRPDKYEILCCIVNISVPNAAR